MPAPVCQLLYCSTVLFKVLYCKIKNVFFIFCVCLFFMYYLCEKYYKPITVQYYIADWVPRLTLLDLWTNWTYEHALGMELVRMQGTYCTLHMWLCHRAVHTHQREREGETLWNPNKVRTWVNSIAPASVSWIFFKIFIYLAAPGLSCGMRGLIF